MAQRNSKGQFTSGNTESRKYDTPAKRKALHKAYIAHCEAGYSDDLFEECAVKTLKSYWRDYPSDFPSDQRHRARAKRGKLIYDVGWRGTMGIPITYTNNQGQIVKADRPFNPKSWQFIAMNILKWTIRGDVTSKGKEVKGETRVIYLPKELPDNYDEIIKPSDARTKSPTI